jgi:hypothetical protein
MNSSAPEQDVYSPYNRCSDSRKSNLAQPIHSTATLQSVSARSIRRFVFSVCLAFLAASMTVAAQTVPQKPPNLPFDVSNPHNKKWSPAEAGRIYSSACQLLARTVRPDKPPALHPQFTLILGTEQDEFVRDGAHVEVHLRSWEPEMFAQAVVAIAVRDLLQGDELQKVAHESVLLANSTISAHPFH